MQSIKELHKPIEERGVEGDPSFTESRWRWECGMETLSNGLSEGLVNGHSPY